MKSRSAFPKRQGPMPRPAGMPQGLSLLALHYAGYAEQLTTPEGRRKIAATYRETYRYDVTRLGWEEPILLTAADAIERGDWRMLGQLLRQVAEQRWQHERQTERQPIRALIARLEGGAP